MTTTATTAQRFEVTVYGRAYPAQRMTQRSKHVSKRAQAHLNWQRQVRDTVWTELLKQCWSADDGPLFDADTRLRVTLMIWLHERSKADVDNLAKAILDAVQTRSGAVLLYHDDNQIDTYNVYLRRAATPADERVTMIVTACADAWAERGAA